MRHLHMTENQYRKFERNPYRWLESNSRWTSDRNKNMIEIDDTNPDEVVIVCGDGYRTKMSAHRYHNSNLRYPYWTHGGKSEIKENYVGTRLSLIVGKKIHTRRLKLHQYIGYLLNIKTSRYSFADHKNRDKSNNTDLNLRPATCAQNSRNRNAKKTSTAGILGIRILTPRKGHEMDPDKFMVSMFQKRIHVGYDLDIAIKYRAAAARLLDPEFFPTHPEVFVPVEIMNETKARIDELELWERV